MRPRRVARTMAVITLCLLAAGAAYERAGARRDRQRLAQVGRSVDIGGRTLNIFCSGEGSPVVVFDAGNGTPGFTWSHIQPRVAAFTRACWYDRAGEGWSDPGPFPRTSVRMAADLHELLHRAGISPPYVLVGHSLGGLNVRVYNGMFPEDVAGAVLVDSAHEDEPHRAPAFMLGHSAPPWLWRPIWWMGQVARATGLLRLTAPRLELATDPSARTREQVVRAFAAQRWRSGKVTSWIRGSTRIRRPDGSIRLSLLSIRLPAAPSLDVGGSNCCWLCCPPFRSWR